MLSAGDAASSRHLQQVDGGPFCAVLSLPLSEHEGGLCLCLVVNRWRAADDDGGPTVSSQRVLQDSRHLAVPVRNVAFLTHNKPTHHTRTVRLYKWPNPALSFTVAKSYYLALC